MNEFKFRLEIQLSQLYNNAEREDYEKKYFKIANAIIELMICDIIKRENELTSILRRYHPNNIVF